MRNFCNIFFINFSNISGNYFLTLSDQTGRFPFCQRKNSPVFYTREFHTASKGPAALLFPYFSPFSLLSLILFRFLLRLFLHQNMVTAPPFSIPCSITNRTLFNKQYDFFSKIINIIKISWSFYLL